jgi:DNA-binding response OmpR family regulator
MLPEIGRLKPELLVIDIMMTGIDGMELCKQIRRTSDITIRYIAVIDRES